MDGVTADELEKAKVIEAPTPTSVRSLDAPVMVLDTHDAIYVWLESSVPVDGASSGQPGYLGSALEDELQERKDGRNPQPQLFVYHGAVHARPVFSALLPDMEAFVADTIVQAEASIASAMERVDEMQETARASAGSRRIRRVRVVLVDALARATRTSYYVVRACTSTCTSSYQCTGWYYLLYTHARRKSLCDARTCTADSSDSNSPRSSDTAAFSSNLRGPDVDPHHHRHHDAALLLMVPGARHERVTRP